MEWAAIPEAKRTVFAGVISDYESNPDNKEAQARVQQVVTALRKKGVTGAPEQITQMMGAFEPAKTPPPPIPQPEEKGDVLSRIKAKEEAEGGASFLDRLDFSNPVGKAAAVAMGGAETFNPLSVFNVGETFGRAVKKNVEGQKLTGKTERRLGVPWPVYEGPSFLQSMGEASKEAVTPRMTFRSLGEAVYGEEAMTEMLPHEYEMAGSLATMLIPAGKGALGLVRGSKAKQARKATENVVRDIKYLTGEGEGVIMRELLENPEAIRALYQGGNVKADDLAALIVKRLDDVEIRLAKEVRKYKSVAEADRGRKITTRPYRERLKQLVAGAEAEPEITLIPTTKKSKVLGPSGEPIRVPATKTVKKGGGTSLSQTDFSEIEKVAKILLPENVSPRDALLAIERLDKAIDWSKESTKHTPRALGAFKQMRGELKEVVRASTPEGKVWATRDDALHTFYENSKGLRKKFDGDQKVSAVNTLLNETKDPVRVRLGASLDAVRQIAPDEVEVSQSFFKMLAQRKGARLLKDVEITKHDKVADQVNRIFKDWVDRGRAWGIAIGTTTAHGAGHLTGGGWLASLALSPVGAAVGHLGGRGLGSVIGRLRGDPLRILAKAQKAKILSAEAKTIAKDLAFFHKTFGPEGTNAAVSLAYELPAMKELARWGAAQDQPPKNLLEVAK